jgi:dienelactone hydrolase
MMRGGTRVLAAGLLTLALASAGCGVNPQLAGTPSVPARERVTSVILHGTSLELHLSRPQGPAKADALVVYASGDGGWYGAAVAMFRRIGGAGYDVVGLSSRAFLKIQRPKGSQLNPAELIAEYRQIAGAARTALGLAPATPVVLTGWSRGAAFAVLAASPRRQAWPVEGVVAIGLSDTEDFEINGPADETDDGPPSAVQGERVFRPYDHLTRLGRLPCAVIQATGDQYLDAAHARALFGVDTPLRRFYAITAKNHRFSGGEDVFGRTLLEALDWITSGRRTAPSDPAPGLVEPR